MNSSVICRDVRSESLNDQTCLVIIASQADSENGRSLDVTDLSQVSEVKAKLESQGIVLGGLLLPANPHAQRTLPSSFQISATDALGRKHLLLADCSEEYSLSSGSTLYYFYVHDAPGDYHWLVGEALEIRDYQKQLTPQLSSSRQDN